MKNCNSGNGLTLRVYCDQWFAKMDTNMKVMLDVCQAMDEQQDVKCKYENKEVE